MLARRFSLALALVLAAVLLGTTPATAGQVTFTAYFDFFDPGDYNLLSPIVEQPNDNGVLVKVTGWVEQLYLNSGDPMTTGWLTKAWDVNCVGVVAPGDKDQVTWGKGPCVGTFRWETDEGGIWEGTVTKNFSYLVYKTGHGGGSENYSGRGTGLYEGMSIQMRTTYQWDANGLISEGIVLN